uniref:Uncharacterized protein n=1 Tax=Strigamia maritima TaxID=126957 RepID=T1JCM3_STRMM
MTESVLPMLPLTQNTLSSGRIRAPSSAEDQPSTYECITRHLSGRYAGWKREKHMRQKRVSRGQIDVIADNGYYFNFGPIERHPPLPPIPISRSESDGGAVASGVQTRSKKVQPRAYITTRITPTTYKEAINSPYKTEW